MSAVPPNERTARLLHQALSFHQQGRLAEALSCYGQVIDVDPHNLDALYGMGMAYGQLGRLDEALQCFSDACALRPDDFSMHYNRGVALQALGRYDEAVAAYERTIVLNPDFADAYVNLGGLLRELKRYDRALAVLDKALVLAPASVMALTNRGAVLEKLQRYDDALAAYDRAIALNPAFAKAHYNRGVQLALLHRYDEALAAYDRAIALDGHYAEAYYNKGLLKLLLGDFATGWPLYEWRWQTELKDYVRGFAQPQWRGEPLSGRTLLLYGDQGFGDIIQMVRYVPLVAARGAKLILEVPAPLVPLLRSLPGEVCLVAKGETLPAFDVQCSLMSLPLVFKTTLDSIPATIPYLAVEPQRQAEWRQRLGQRVRPRVGLAWSGNPQHPNDPNRSIVLASLASLLALNGEFHSLQKEVRAEDRAALAAHAKLNTHEHEFNDFADTAALVAELDLVITVDTAVAHLAGALGKPVWVLLPYDPDFRWLMGRDDSPWYPTARLFRQGQGGDWQGVITAVRDALAASLDADS